MGWLRQGVLGSVMLVWLASTALAQSDEAPPPVVLDAEAQAEAAEEVAPSAPEDRGPQWFIGAYWRHLWIPSYMIGPFFDRAPSITNDGFGLTVTHRAPDGFSMVLGVGWTPYHLRGAFTATGHDTIDTEIAASDLDFIHVTGSLLWNVEFHRMLSLEIGFGLDMGVLLGELRRDEAYFDQVQRKWRVCNGPLSPPLVDPADPAGPAFCDTPVNGGASDASSDEGEHYNVTESRVPPVMLFPMFPHLALRFAPHEQVAVKAEFAFGVVQIWLGASLHVGFGEMGKKPAEAPVEVPALDEGLGRVLGKVIEYGTDIPVAGADVAPGRRGASALRTDDNGVFVADRLQSGPIRFEITAPGYEDSVCNTTVPDGGEEVHLRCKLAPLPELGAISGTVKNTKGRPVDGALVQITGTRTHTVTTDGEGLFAVPDLGPGAYHVKVDADDYLMQLVQVEVGPDETATPQIVLIPKPKKSLVQVKQSEIVIMQQVNFETNSAVIGSRSHGLMNEIADVLLRNPRIERVEIQGHTDSTGKRDKNQALSQARAESVRDWLTGSGVAPERLEARGYGQERPLKPNNTKFNRAKNRRVQFIIKQQSR